MVFRILSLGLAVIAVLGLGPQAPAAVEGVVFEDRNGNGLRDPEEPGISGVVVSNQVDTVATDGEGNYLLDGNRGYGFVFIVSSATLRPVGRFWRRIPSTPEVQVDFPMALQPVAETFSFIHASDTHLSKKSLPRFRRLREIVEARKPAFVLITGDLVQDALRVSESEATGYYDLYRREIEEFPVPVYSSLGNHEIFAIERHQSLVSKVHPLYGKKMFREYLGPNYYAFQFGGVYFVSLDTLDFEDLWYYGRVDESQLGWLDQFLTFIPDGATVVTFNHVPFFSAWTTIWGYSESGIAPTVIQVPEGKVFRHTVSNALEVLERFERFDHTLALAGHIHTGEKLQFENEGTQTRFYQTAAVAGPHENGLRMLSGVTLYRVQGEEIDDGEFIPLDEEPAAPSNEDSREFGEFGAN